MATLVPHPLKPRRPPKGSACFVAGPHAIGCRAYLRELGYEVLDGGLSSLREGVRALCDADFVVVVPGWQFDRWANIQVGLARDLKLPILECDDLESVYLP